MVIALRGKAMARLAGEGGMLSVSLPVSEVDALIEPYGRRVSVAAINGPASTVLSGEPGALSELLDACERDGVRVQRIAVDYAAHSAQIEALRPDLLEAFAAVSLCSAEIPFPLHGHRRRARRRGARVQIRRYEEELGDLFTKVAVPNGHNLLWESPAETMEAVTSFLAG